MNKNELYESIMKNVAKQVKKALNENEEDDWKANERYYVPSVGLNADGRKVALQLTPECCAGLNADGRKVAIDLTNEEKAVATYIFNAIKSGRTPNNKVKRSNCTINVGNVASILVNLLNND